MYHGFYGLRESPFRGNPDPRYLWINKQVAGALAGLMYGIHSRKGFITLIGEVGTGKTTILNHLLNWLQEQRTKTAFIFNSRMRASHLFDLTLAEFEIPCPSRDKSQQLQMLNQWLLERYRAGENALLVVDEAHHLSLPLLEEIRLLTNLETATDKLLQIVLSGQPELDEILKLPEVRALRQRIAIRCTTELLTCEQTHKYVTERLRMAGAVGDIFSPGALDTVHLYSRGIPRVINLLCEHSLVNAYVEELRPVPSEVVRGVAREFQLDQIAPIVTGERSLATGSCSEALQDFGRDFLKRYGFVSGGATYQRERKG